jgi:cystathionine beta-lyase family protein involved in aluminum resistance
VRPAEMRALALEAVGRREEELREREERILRRLLAAFARQRLAHDDLGALAGYGYDDPATAKVEAVIAELMGTEDAFFRTQIVSGTHAIALTLEALVGAVGGRLLFVFGPPYDTLEPLVGGRGAHPRSLVARGVPVEVLPFGPEGRPEALLDRLPQGPGVAWLQRSMGYQDRPTVPVAAMRPLVAALHRLGYVVAVDNCYGEWTEDEEPGHVGADVVVGSLLKNAGGGLSPYGAYVAGRRDLLEPVAERLFGLPLGRRVAPHEPLLPFVQGLFLGPHFVGQALRGAIYAAALFAAAGFPVFPSPQAPRGCIVQAIELGSPERLARFCEAIQAASPLEAYVRPRPAPTPGYAHPIVMAGGTFVPGGTLELSADGRFAPPYRVFVQGGLSFAHAALALDAALSAVRASAEEP